MKKVAACLNIRKMQNDQTTENRKKRHLKIVVNFREETQIIINKQVDPSCKTHTLSVISFAL